MTYGGCGALVWEVSRSWMSVVDVARTGSATGSAAGGTGGARASRAARDVPARLGTHPPRARLKSACGLEDRLAVAAVAVSWVIEATGDDARRAPWCSVAKGGSVAHSRSFAASTARDKSTLSRSLASRLCARPTSSVARGGGYDPGMPPGAHTSINRRLRISNTRSSSPAVASAPSEPSPHSPGTSAIGTGRPRISAREGFSAKNVGRGCTTTARHRGVCRPRARRRLLARLVRF